MAKPTGLQKAVVDVSFRTGLVEKIAPEMAPPEGMYQLENVELDKLGSLNRRRGFEIMTSSVLGPTGSAGGASSIGTPKKVGGRAQELFVISEESGYLGSGGGAGNAGSILWSYSPESDLWRAHGKVPNCTLEREFGLSNGQVLPGAWNTSAYVATGGDPAHRYIVTAYLQNDWGASAPGLHGMVFDTVSKTMILEDAVLEQTVDIQVHSVGIGQYGVIVYRPLATSAQNTRAIVYDAANPGSGFSAFTNILSASISGGFGWAIATDGTFLYVLSIGNTGVVVLRKFSVTPTVTQVATLTIATTGAISQPGVSIAGGMVHVTWKHSGTARPWHGVTTTDLLTPPVITEVHTDAVGGASNKVFNVALTSTDVVVFWDSSQTPPGSFNHVAWRWLGRANVHRQPGVLMLTHPFVKNSRVYIGLTGCYAGPDSVEGAYTGSNQSNLGHVLCEIPSIPIQEDSATGNPYAMMMPIALWGRDVSVHMSGASHATPGGDGDIYITSLREARKSDAIFRDFAQQLFPTPHTIAVWAIDVVRIAFANPKRWQHAELDNQTVIACALPYVYDGDRAHECGYVFRPGFGTITQPDVPGAGVWKLGDIIFYKTVYEWEDFAGRRWFSDSSYPYQVTIQEVTGGGFTRDPLITPRQPWLTMKPDGANNFRGRVKINTYRAKFASPTEYKLVNSQVHMIWEATGGRETGEVESFSDAGADLSSTEDMYTVGGELDNWVAPSCVSLIQHRDRLFAISLEDNSLYYTKPFRPGRGIEWSRFQGKALPQRGMALGSLEGSLVVLTDKSILILDGPGPSATGVPADAFARFAVLSQDQGCSELCAAWRCPRGLIFRSHQGLWMITPQMAIIYIGAAVEELVKAIDYFVDASVDEALGCIRLLGSTGGDFRTLIYWYDSDRWSSDVYFLTPAGTQYSSVFLQGQYYLASSRGVRKQNPDVWQDGVEVVANDDVVYKALFKTGWLRFDTASSFKRLWRVLLTLRHQSAKQTGWGVRVVVESDTNSATSTSTFDFYPEDFAAGVSSFSGTLRMHLKYQKGQRYRITVSELQGAALAAYNPGYSFSSLGFELGMKRGSAKLGEERSPTTTT